MTSPLVFPQNLMIDEADYEKPVEVPFGMGASAAFASSVSQSVESESIGKAIDWYNEAFNPGRHLGANEIKESYPHVASLFPNGGSEYAVSNLAEKKERELYYQDLMAGMKPGKLSTVGRETMSLIGLGVSPTNIFAGIGAEMTVGKLGLWAAERLVNANALAKVATRAIGGASETGVMAIPLTISSREYYNQIGMPLTPEETFYSMATMMAVGSVLRTAFGYKKIIDPESHWAALAAAKAQADRGEKVDVSKLIKNGVYQERVLDPDAKPEEIGRSIELLKERAKTTDETIERNQRVFDDLAKGKEEIEPSDAHSLETKDLLNRVNALGDLPEQLLTDEDKALLGRLPNTDEFKSAMTYSRVSKDELNPEQSKFLENFKADEVKVTHEGIERNTKRIVKLEKQIKKEPAILSPEEIKAQKGQIKELKGKIEVSKDRIKTLNKIEKEPVKIKNTRRALRALRADSATLKNMIKDTESYLDLVNAAEPVTEAELKTAAAKVGDWKNQSTTYLNDYYKNARKMEEPEIPVEDALKESQEDVQQLADANELNPEEKTALAEAKDIPRKEGKINQLLKAFAKCVNKKG